MHPDERTVLYYLSAVTRFMQSFLDDQYRVDLAVAINDYLGREYLPLIGLAPAGAVAKVRALRKISPPTAVIEAFNDLEHKLLSVISANHPTRPGEPISPIWRRSDLSEMVRGISAAGYLPADADQKIERFRFARNAAAHGARVFGEKPDRLWDEVLEDYFELVECLNRAVADGFLYRGEGLSAQDEELEVAADTMSPHSGDNKAVAYPKNHTPSHNTEEDVSL